MAFARGKSLTPAEVRRLLSDPRLNTPSANPGADRIGVMPNLRNLAHNIGAPRFAGVTVLARDASTLDLVDIDDSNDISRRTWTDNGAPEGCLVGPRQAHAANERISKRDSPIGRASPGWRTRGLYGRDQQPCPSRRLGFRGRHDRIRRRDLRRPSLGVGTDSGGGERRRRADCTGDRDRRPDEDCCTRRERGCSTVRVPVAPARRVLLRFRWPERRCGRARLRPRHCRRSRRAASLCSDSPADRVSDDTASDDAHRRQRDDARAFQPAGDRIPQHWVRHRRDRRGLVPLSHVGASVRGQRLGRPAADRWTRQALGQLECRGRQSGTDYTPTCSSSTSTGSFAGRASTS